MFQHTTHNALLVPEFLQLCPLASLIPSGRPTQQSFKKYLVFLYSHDLNYSQRTIAKRFLKMNATFIVVFYQFLKITSGHWLMDNLQAEYQVKRAKIMPCVSNTLQNNFRPIPWLHGIYYPLTKRSFHFQKWSSQIYHFSIFKNWYSLFSFLELTDIKQF